MLVLFSSHSWDYTTDREGLHRLISARWRKGIDWCDLSVSEAHPLDLRSKWHLQVEIATRIAASDVVIAFPALYSAYSDWIEFEVQQAWNAYKPILAVIPWGQKNLSSFVMDRASLEAGWNGKSIRNGILELLPARRYLEVRPGLRRSEQAAEAWELLSTMYTGADRTRRRF